MQQVTERDNMRGNRFSRGNATKLIVILGALAFLALVAVCIQLFARYQYIMENGVVWRIDRITQQACRVTYGRVNCGPPVSRSVSTSTSISTSTSPRIAAPRRPKKT